MVHALVFLSKNEHLLEGQTAVRQPAGATVSLFDPQAAGEDEFDEDEPVMLVQ